MDTLSPDSVPSTSRSLTNADPASRELALLQMPLAAVPAPLDKAPSDDVAGPELADPDPGAPNETFRLKNRQRMVLEFMTMGMNVSDIAKLTNVNRTTIHRWMKFDADFKAALTAWHERVVASARAQMASAADMAMKVVLRKVEAGDLQAALAVLRGNGLYATGGNPASPVIAAQPGEQPTLPEPQLRPLAELYGSGAIVPLLCAPPTSKALELPAPSAAVQEDPAGIMPDPAPAEAPGNAS